MYTAPTNDELSEHRSALTRLARSLVGQDEAEDVVQDAYVAIQGSEGVRTPVAWLRGTVRRIARKHHRTQARVRRRERTHGRGAIHAGPATDEIAEALETQRSLMRALRSLADDQRIALELRYFDGLQPRQISQQLGVPVATVKGRLSRGLQAMRTRLDSAHDGSRARWQLALAALLRGPSAAQRVAWLAPLGLAVLVLGVVGLGWWFLGGAPRWEADARGEAGAGLTAALERSEPRLRGSLKEQAAPPAERETRVAERESGELDLSERPPWTLDLILDIALPRAHHASDLELQGTRVTVQVVDTEGRHAGALEGILQSSSKGWACRLGLAFLAKHTPAERARLRLIPSIEHKHVCAEREFGEYALRVPLWPARSYRRETLHCSWGERRSFLVVAEDGNPVPGAFIHISTRSDDTGRHDVDGRGRFECALPSWEGARVTAYHPGHGYAQQAVAGADRTTVRLAGTHWLEGTVSLASGTPVPHLPVRVGLHDTDHDFTGVQYTDELGRFRVAVTRGGPGVLELESAGAWGPTYSLPLQSGVENEIELPWSGLTLESDEASEWHAESLHFAWWADRTDRPDDRPYPESPLPTGGDYPSPRFPITLVGIPGTQARLRFGSAGRGLRMVSPVSFPESGIVRTRAAMPILEVPGEVHLDLKTVAGGRCFLQHWRLFQGPAAALDGGGRYILGDSQRKLESAHVTPTGVILRDLPPGEWLLWVHASPKEEAEGGVFGLSRPYVPVTVRPGEPTQLEIRLRPSARLHIRWEPEDGPEFAICHLELRRRYEDGSPSLWVSPSLDVRPHKRIRAHESARVMAYLEPGRYDLRVRIGRGEFIHRTIELRAGSEHSESYITHAR